MLVIRSGLYFKPPQKNKPRANVVFLVLINFKLDNVNIEQMPIKPVNKTFKTCLKGFKVIKVILCIISFSVAIQRLKKAINFVLTTRIVLNIRFLIVVSVATNHNCNARRYVGRCLFIPNQLVLIT